MMRSRHRYISAAACRHRHARSPEQSRRRSRRSKPLCRTVFNTDRRNRQGQALGRLRVVRSHTPAVNARNDLRFESQVGSAVASAVRIACYHTISSDRRAPTTTRPHGHRGAKLDVNEIETLGFAPTRGTFQLSYQEDYMSLMFDVKKV